MSKINIGDLLKKPLWRRRISRQQSVLETKGSALNPRAYEPMMFDNGRERLMTQSDFLDELEPCSHLVYNVNYKANRPKMKYNQETKENEFCGFDDVARVAVALQESLRRNKAVCTFGNDVWFGNEGTEDQTDELIRYKSHWNISGMRNALLQFARSAYGTGDGAVYLYREKNEIKYKVFSFENGDVIAENIDQRTGEKVFIRMYMIDDSKIVEIYNKTNIEVWANNYSGGMLKTIWKTINGETSEDGYVLLQKHEHNTGECPIAYHREKDVCWGSGQKAIERIEDIKSDLAENNKYYAFQILYLTGGTIKLPDSMWQGKALGGKTKDSDAKILEPANCSDSFKLDLETSLRFFYETTSTTVVTPEQLKGGDYSGAYIRNLYFRDVQWTAEASARLDPFMKKVISIFKSLVGQIENDTIGYDNLKISYKIVPFLPQNELEETTILAMGVNSGFLSIETAQEENPRSNPEEMNRIISEMKAKEERDLKSENVGGFDNVNVKPEDPLKVDNQAKGKSNAG